MRRRREPKKGEAEAEREGTPLGGSRCPDVVVDNVIDGHVLRQQDVNTVVVQTICCPPVAQVSENSWSILAVLFRKGFRSTTSSGN